MFICRRLHIRGLRNALLPLFEGDARFSSNRGGVLSSGLEDLDIPEVSIGKYTLEKYGKWENHVAVECGVTGRKYTYKQVVAKTKNLSSALRKKFKLEKGDVIALLSPNVPEYPIAINAALEAGLICTTVNPLYTPEEVAKQLSDSNAKAMIILTDMYPLAAAVKNILKKDLPILSINSQEAQSTPPRCANFAEFADNNVDHIDVSISHEDVAFLPYSSGTTGLPKGVELTHFNIVANMCQLGHPKIAFSFETTPDHQDITPAILPMFHIYGLTILSLFQLRLGCKIVTLPKFIPEIYLQILKGQKPDVLYVVPPMAIFLANHPGVKQQDFDCLRCIVNGAAALGPLDSAKLIKKSGRDLPILQGYGLTETSPAILTTRQCHIDNKSAAGTLGSPVPNTEVKIVNIENPNDPPLGPHQIGELLVRGPQVMKGYFRRPEEKPFIDGWFRTGDMMYYTDDGYLFFTDRLKELIKVKGFQVAPAELEEIIRDFPGVVESAVIGIPHKSLGEVPRAYVVPKEGAKLNCDKLADFINKKVAPFKQLKGGIHVVESIPKSASGKILRRVLKLKYQNDGV